MTHTKRFAAVALVSALLLSAAYADNDTLDAYFGGASYHNVNFTDIDEPAWATDAIRALAQYGVISGEPAYFHPNDAVTRAQLVKIIVLAFGLYDETAGCGFADVPPGSWQYPYIASAQKLGIASGMSKDYFGESESVTREQLATMVYNTMVYLGITLDAQTPVVFADEGSISEYAAVPVRMLSAAGVISGDQNRMFDPKNHATRAQVCKIIYTILLKNP